MTQPTPRRFHIWAPNMFEFKGGIQVYSSFLVEALHHVYANSIYHVFLKHDKQESDFRHLAQTHFHFSGRWPLSIRTVAFSLQLMICGISQRPNLVIATHPNFAPVAYGLKRINNTPYWVVTHGIDAWNIKHPVLKVALRNADRIISVSSYTRQRLLDEQNLEPSKVSILANTFDANQFQIAPKPVRLLEQYGIQEDQPVILTVARLAHSERYKGYDQIIEALPSILKGIPNIHYIIVGKGPDRDRIEQLIQHKGLTQHVTLAGFVPDAELGDYYNLCDVFAMPSKQEGFGIVYLEALASGKPVIGGNQDGAVDALRHGKLGVLVDPDNIAEIAQTIVQILQRRYEHPLLYQPERLRQAVIENFGFERFTQTLAGYLSTQLGQSDACNAHHSFPHS